MLARASGAPLGGATRNMPETEKEKVITRQTPSREKETESEREREMGRGRQGDGGGGGGEVRERENVEREKPPKRRGAYTATNDV